MRKVLIAAFVLGLATPALASEPMMFGAEGEKAKADKAPVKGGRNDPDRIVCTREHVVGSNRPVKVCMTVAERQKLKDKSDYALDPSRRTADNEDSLRQQGAAMGQTYRGD